MRAVAAALVLIVAAAVVLWYGNTLNSWVLGGLIGGLAALLLSIPISLTIFSFLSRRHDERLRADEDMYEEEYGQVHEYLEVPERVVRSMYVVAEDRPRSRREVWEEEEEWDERDEEEDFYRRTDAVRRVVPQEPPRLPAPGYSSQQKPVPRLLAPQRGMLNSRQLPASSKQLPEHGALNSRQLSAREREITSRRPAPQRTNYPGTPGYQAEVPQSQLRSQALRTARLEAARQREEDEIEELPSYRPRRSPVVRPTKPLPEQQGDEQVLSRGMQQGAKHYPRRPRHLVDTSPTQNGVPPVLPADKQNAYAAIFSPAAN